MNFKLVLIFSLSLPNIPVKRIAQETYKEYMIGEYSIN